LAKQWNTPRTCRRTAAIAPAFLERVTGESRSSIRNRRRLPVLAEERPASPCNARRPPR
jgi:hypothetical protein